MSGSGRYDVDFSLAMRNRTGKYVIGRDIVADQADRIDRVLYWRMPLDHPPGKWMARGLEVAAQAELRLRGAGWLPTFRGRRPLLHLDPYTVLVSGLEVRDIVLVHDMGPVTHPELFGEGVPALYRQAFERIGVVGPRLVFVSQASLDAFVETCGAVADMRVIYPPIRTAVTSAMAEPVGIRGPFLLTVGSLGRRKNQLRCIEAFATSGLHERGVSYVLCGAREPGADAVEAAAHATPGVHLLPYVTDGQLAWLYANAAGFVLVSLLEGFGMPVAEAMTRGLVPLIARGTVLAEVAGEGALSASPHDGDEIAAGMVALAGMNEAEKHRRLASLGAHLRGFSNEAFRAGWSAVMR